MKRYATSRWQLAFSSIRHQDQTHYPLLVQVEHADRLRMRLYGRRQFFSPEAVEAMASRVAGLLEGLCVGAQRCLADIAWLSPREQALVSDWSTNARRYGEPELIHHLIERQSKQLPHATALVFGDHELSYEELNRRANQLAHWLIRWGVRPEVRVGIAAERSVEMVVALLAILKAGGAYVPLDPEYPRDRLSYMLQDSGIGLLLTQGSVAPGLPLHQGLTAVQLETLDVGGESAHDPRVALHAEHLAYVIYTSGSTGRPKGAANRHGSLYNRLGMDAGGVCAEPGRCRLAEDLLQFRCVGVGVFLASHAGSAAGARRARRPARSAETGGTDPSAPGRHVAFCSLDAAGVLVSRGH